MDKASGTVGNVAERLYKTLTEFQEAPYDITLDIPVFTISPQDMSATVTQITTVTNE